MAQSHWGTNCKSKVDSSVFVARPPLSKVSIFLLPMLGRLIDWYALHFPFPHRGLKYLLKLVKALGMANRDFKKKTFLGLRFNCNLFDHIEQYIFWYGYYEKPETGWLLKNIHRYGSFYDIGANIGYFSLAAAAACTHVEVYAFEPSDYNRNRFLQNLDLNQHLAGRIRLFPVALGNTEEMVSFYQASLQNSGMSGLAEVPDFVNKTEVKISTFDQLAAQWNVPLPALIKIDVEGYEFQVLQGMKKTLEAKRPDLLIELDERHLGKHGSNKEALIHWLRSLGYTAYQPNENGEMKPLSHSFSPISLAYFTHNANA